MIKTQRPSSAKKPEVKTDLSLEKLRGQNLFPEKLPKANDTIKRVGLPKLSSSKVPGE